MKVIIIKSSDCDSELAKKTYDVLNGISGKIEFELIENKVYSLRDISSHDDIFRVCTDFRKKQNVNSESFVVLLTQTSFNNWFSAFDGNKNIYVRTDEWELYTEVPAEYSIAYSIAENILQTFMGLDINKIDWKYIHREPIACVNDFCGLKRDIIRKIQSAAICPTCLAKIKFDGVDKSILKHLVAIFDTIRKVFRDFEYGIAEVADEENISNNYMMELDRYGMHVKKEGKDEKEYTINFNASQLSFYVFLILHEKGIRFSNIDQNGIELLSQLYDFYSNRLDEKKNPFVNISEGDKFAQYRYHTNSKIIEKGLGEDFQISSNSNYNRITFDRELFKCSDNRVKYLARISKEKGMRIRVPD
jgi:hypothetical protein